MRRLRDVGLEHLPHVFHLMFVIRQIGVLVNALLRPFLCLEHPVPCRRVDARRTLLSKGRSRHGEQGQKENAHEVKISRNLNQRYQSAGSPLLPGHYLFDFFPERGQVQRPEGIFGGEVVRPGQHEQGLTAEQEAM